MVCLQVVDSRAVAAVNVPLSNHMLNNDTEHLFNLNTLMHFGRHKFSTSTHDFGERS